MNRDLRCVFDVNVIVSALLFEESVPGRAFFLALKTGEIVISHDTFTELNDVLHREKFDRYVTHDERDEFLATFLRETTLVEITQEIHACRDARDGHILELAVSADASCVVTGDVDLLTLHPFRSIPIMTPDQFL